MMDGETPMIETYFVMIRELDRDDDPHDESSWPKPNPILQDDNEYSRELLRQIRTEHDEAFFSGNPDKIRRWLIKRVNRWQSDSANKYMSGLMERWKALAVSREAFLSLVHGRETWLGLDLSKRIDLTAAGFVFKLDGAFEVQTAKGTVKPLYAVTAHGFMPEETATKHEHSDRVPYRAWAKDDWCTLTEGAVTDYRHIKTHIHDLEASKKWNVVEADYDPYNATHFAMEMVTEGYETVEIRQGVQTLSEPTKYFRELVLKGLIVHDGSPLLTWCLSNAVEVIDNNGNIKLSKKHKDDSQRIDLIAAIINAMVRAMLNTGKKRSRYETEDVRAI